jgi:hypothetical protein
MYTLYRMIAIIQAKLKEMNLTISYGMSGQTPRNQLYIFIKGSLIISMKNIQKSNLLLN